MTIGGYITADLGDAQRAHAEMGGYLLCIGDRPPEYVVCEAFEAIEVWGRTMEQLQALGPGYSEV